ncbi:hypothetical protein FHG89_14050 [Micromonospora orduensis]|uniref:Uncharacterized protein n=1 Tax=Micromonospora orduensis TaxID=1420891 RepID=A0A5C4QTL9_9ACTN|nr:hypothetical protein [Micromonospora orduensis]TNH28767.1 hypothetical protein FHG89_14050 [Micromonospora orduensis]
MVTLVLVVLASAVTWWVWPKGPDRKPFDQAVAGLAAAEAVTYQTSLGGLTTDTRVTRHGDSIGTLTLAGQRFELMTVNGRNYLKAPSGALPGGAAVAGMRNRWFVGNSGLAGLGQGGVAPPQLAQRLRAVVDHATTFNRSSVNGNEAYVARAPDGNLFVTSAKPHRVLRFTPRGIANLPSLPSLPTMPGRPADQASSGPPPPSSRPSLPDPSAIPSLPSLPTLPPLPGGALVGVRHRQPTPPGGAQAQQPPGLDVSPLTPEQTDDLYTDLISSGTQLVEAADPNVQFTAQVTGQIACGGACTVNASVTNQVTGQDETTVTGAQVTAEMTATISVDGRVGGTCVSPPTPIQTNGAGQLSCLDPASGALAQAVLAQKKAAAGGKGGVVSVVVTAQVEVYAKALTTAQVRQEVDRQKQERQQARGSRAPPVYPAEGIKVGPVSLGARQSGTAAPIRVDGLTANKWDNNKPKGQRQDGLLIEDALGGNLPDGVRDIDYYSAHDGGTAISMKSIDPRSDSYSVEPGTIASVGIGYVKAIDNYRRGFDLWNPLVPPDAVSVWVLRIAYPAGTSNPEFFPTPSGQAKFLAALERIKEEAAQKNIVLQFVPIEG